MAPSVAPATTTTSSKRDTTTVNYTSSPSNVSVPSLELSEGMVTPLATPGGIHGGDENDTKKDKDENETLPPSPLNDATGEAMLSKTTTHSSSSSLWNSDDGVTGENDVEDEGDNYGDNCQALLKDCWEAVAASAPSIAGEMKNSNDVNKSDDESHESGGNDHEFIDDQSYSTSDSSNTEGIQSFENLAQTRNNGGYKDPFPVLTPIPPTSARKSLKSQFNNSKNNNTKLNIVQTIPRDLMTPNISMHPPAKTPMNDNINKNLRGIMNNNKSSNNKRSKKRISTTPPFTPYIPQSAAQTTPKQHMSVQTTPIKSPAAYNNTNGGQNHQSWIDPFPTPDASVHSLYSTPCSSRIRRDELDEDFDDDYLLDNRNSIEEEPPVVVLDKDWDTLLQTIPKIPPMEELDEDKRRRGGKMVNKSCPRLQSMGDCCPRLKSLGVAELPVRKVASESNMPLIKRASFEDIWSALKYGPDGNELIPPEEERSEHIRQMRRNSDKGLISRRQLFDHHTNVNDEYKGPPLRRRSKEQLSFEVSDEYQTPLRRPSSKEAIERSYTEPVKRASWRELQSPLMASPDDDNNANKTENISHDRHDNHIDNNRKAQLIRNNSSTITNVTGADLAREVKMIIGKRNEQQQQQQCPMTPNRLSFFSPVKTVASVYRTNTRRASTFVQNTCEKLKKRKERRRLRRLQRLKEPPRSWWIVIPADHPYKIAWDVLTMLWALLGAYRTHVRIRDRVFDQSPLIILTEIWFTVDILLNFVTEHKTSKGQVIRDGKAVWARYLTTWFIIDILSLIPWERIYVRPVVEKIKKRNFFQKTFFRSKAVVRVSRVLRGRHIKLFGRVSKQTGTPLRRLVSLVIKYLPKYLVFLRNMKGALVVRALRFVHWLHNMYKKIWVKAKTARQTYIARRAARRSLVDMFGRPHALGEGNNSDDSEDDSGSDDDDGDDSELDQESDSDYHQPLRNFHRTQSAPSQPLPLRRRRSYSQNEVYAR